MQWGRDGSQIVGVLAHSNDMVWTRAPTSTIQIIMKDINIRPGGGEGKKGGKEGGRKGGEEGGRKRRLGLTG